LACKVLRTSGSSRVKSWKLLAEQSRAFSGSSPFTFLMCQRFGEVRVGWVDLHGRCCKVPRFAFANGRIIQVRQYIAAKPAQGNYLVRFGSGRASEIDFLASPLRRELKVGSVSSHSSDMSLPPTETGPMVDDLEVSNI
jgi:hypothetical protein